jgi:hypothetical protein
MSKINNNSINNSEIPEHLKDNLSNMTTEESKNILWSNQLEIIICNWADQAQCYQWLCYNSHLRYSRLQATFSIPTIIFSTVIGAASFTNISGNFSQYLPIVIGSVNITIGIFTTIQQYFKISEYNENFRICSRAWDKYAREIQLELSKTPDQRKECGLFLKKTSEDFERLMETTSDFPDDIIGLFIRTFKGRPNSQESRNYNMISKPRLIEGIYPTSSNRNSWYLECTRHNHDDDKKNTLFSLQYDDNDENKTTQLFNNITPNELQEV